jgi:hypothetical protein
LANRLGICGRAVDLYVRFVDAAGNPVNADDIPTVEIYDSASVRRQAATRIGVGLHEDPGLYVFSYNIPLIATDGYWSDTWTAKIGNNTVSSTFDFLVMSAGEVEESAQVIYAPGDDLPWDFTKEEAHGINVLLKMLKPRLKNDGIRKIPDGQGGYIEETCSVFTNTELICFLVNSLSSFNQIPHFTNFTFENPQMYTTFADVIVQGASLLAMSAQALIEKGREFSITDNGVTYQPPAISEILNNQFTTQLTDYKEKLKVIKCNMKPAPLGLGSFRVTAVSPAYLRLRHLRERQVI